MKRLFGLLIVLLLLGTASVSYAQTYGDGKHTVKQGLYSDTVSVHWYYNSNILVFTGTGKISVSDFNQYRGIEEIVIEKGISEINGAAYCFKDYFPLLCEITVESGNENYCSQDGVLFNKDKTMLIKYPEAKPDKEYVIPSTVRTLEWCSFEKCANLEKVTLPDGITGNGNEFDYSTKLSEIVCLGDADVSGIEDTAFYNDESNWENGMLYLGNSLVSAKRYDDETDEWYEGVYEIKDGTKRISTTAFYDASLMPHNETVIIPESVQSAAYRWVDGNGYCHTSFGPVGMSCGIQYEWKDRIPDDMFTDCEIKSIFITSEITEIGANNFGRGLTDVYYEGSKEDWDKIVIGEGNDFSYSEIHYNYDFEQTTPIKFLESFGTVFFTAVNVPAAADVLVVGYNENSEMVFVDEITLKNGYFAEEYDLNDADYLKMFIWDNGLKPLCETETTEIYK